LEAFDDWTMPAAWSFVISFSTPQILFKAGKRKWKKFLHIHKLGRPTTYQRRLKIFARAHQFAGSDAAVRAKSRLAVARAKQLQLLEVQLAEYRQESAACLPSIPMQSCSGHCPAPATKSRRVCGLRSAMIAPCFLTRRPCELKVL
jgi:hypothetical protein